MPAGWTSTCGGQLNDGPQPLAVTIGKTGTRDKGRPLIESRGAVHGIPLDVRASCACGMMPPPLYPSGSARPPSPSSKAIGHIQYSDQKDYVRCRT